MNYGVDVIGINSVALVIRQSGLPLFYITRFDAHLSSTPIFEVTEGKSIEPSVSKFTDWATTVLKGNPNNDNKYTITLYRKGKDEAKEEDLQKTGHPKRERSERISFSFMLQDPKLNEYNAHQPHYIAQQPTQQQPQIDLSQYIPVSEFQNRLNERLLIEKMKMEIEALKLRKQDDEDDFDDEEEEEKPNAFMGIITEIGKHLLNKNGLVPATPTPTPANLGASINGVEFTEEELDRIDDAIELMRVQDPNIIVSLEKLAKISKDNPEQFKNLLMMLKNF